MLPLAAAVAVTDVTRSLGGVAQDAQIKWPNDVVVGLGGGQGGLAKLAGILVEARPGEGWAVLGIGLNVAVRLDELPPELRPGSPQLTGLPAATLGLGPEAVELCLERLLEALEVRLRERPEDTLADWSGRDALRGRHVSWAGGAGTAAGVDGEGRLIVELPGGGRTAIAAGEVHLDPLSPAPG
jgi:BirA family biotin operon repressor/biotin-[acetyl-CoA-carboxylase] ligase